MSVQAELLAAQALRDHLLLNLPAKVASINAERAAVLRAPRAGPYTIPVDGALALGTVIGTATEVALTAGVRTATQVAAEITAAAIPGLTAGVDSKDRLYVQTSAAPEVGAASEFYLAPDVTAGTNAAFGWSPGGHSLAVSALVAPDYHGISDGEPGAVPNLTSGFFVIIGQRSAAPAGNLRRDIHVVRIQLEVFAAEPNGRVDAMRELIAQAVRAIREVILEDRRLGGAVYLTEIPGVQYAARPFRFTAGNVSALFVSAPMTVLVHVFERS